MAERETFAAVHLYGWIFSLSYIWTLSEGLYSVAKIKAREKSGNYTVGKLILKCGI